jgi:hypothetical protein
MKYSCALILVFLLSVPAWAEPAGDDPSSQTPSGEQPASEEIAYKQPYPHSSGADLLPFCQQTDVVVSQLRCDYYVQGVADLVTTPLGGVRLACIPQGQNRTQLMQMAVDYLQRVPPDTLETDSAASLIVKAFRKKFPCPKIAAPIKQKGQGDAAGSGEEAPAITPEMAEEIRKAMRGK